MRLHLILLLAASQVWSFTVDLGGHRTLIGCRGWVEVNGEWEWQEDDPTYRAPVVIEASATPKLPSGSYKPKQSLGQNYLKDPNTVAKIIRAFHTDATTVFDSVDHIVELGPGAGALTDKLVETYGTDVLECIEIDPRSVQILQDKHPGLEVHHADVLQVDYPSMATTKPLVVVGNLPYYITSQILFALADASHEGAVQSATVTMQWEVAQRMVAGVSTKDYGILSVVFQLYADVKCHFKIPPTVFYPKPKVDSALVGLQFYGPDVLRERLRGVRPTDLRQVVTTAFRQRRKTVRNSLKKLVQDVCNGDADAIQAMWSSVPDTPPSNTNDILPEDWASKRPEELRPGQFVELTRLLYGAGDADTALGQKVWRKLKHGSNE